MAAATSGFTEDDMLCVNTIRCLSADQPQAANSGHPGAPMGMAPMAHLLWSRYLKFSASNPKWPARDRFVLSNGHACALLYSMLHLSGYAVSLDDLRAFRKLDSITPGHPEFHQTPGVEATTGPLGQGLSSAVGMAIAEAHLAAIFNKPGFNIVDNYVFVFCGDGCLQEGITSEASSLAGHLGLGKLIVLYDDNHITIDGETDLAFTEDVCKRYESYGWHTLIVADGDHDFASLSAAIEEAKRVTDKPSLIKVHTTIGFGSKNQGTEKVHGSPLGEADLAFAKTSFGFDPSKKFFVPDSVREIYGNIKARGEESEREWNILFEKYEKEYPTEAADFKRRFEGRLPEGWANVLPKYKPGDAPAATRKLSQTCLQALAPILPDLVGGSADLNPSTFTYLNCSIDFQKATPHGRNIRFGVREHAMAAVVNGLAYYGGFIPYCSTFLNFIGYSWGGTILSAVSHLRTLHIMTHDSIGLGEDGPTHQPVEKLMLIRSTPNMALIRPADGNETTAAYITALSSPHRPSVLALSRQNLPHYHGSSVEGALKGAYVLQDSEGAPHVIITATGSEVEIAVAAKTKLEEGESKINVRVVSFPCWEVFEEQSLEYKQSVFLPGVPVVSVEAGSVLGWERYAHVPLGLTTFGASGPYQAVYAKVGLSVDAVSAKVRKTVEFYSSHPVPDLWSKPSF